MDQPEHKNGDPLSLTAERRVNEICNAFEEELKAGRQPRIEDSLRDTPEPKRSALLRELLKLELAYAATGAELFVNDYVTRFPEHAELVRAVLQAATPKQQLISTTDDRPGTQVDDHEDEPFPLIPGYEILEKLGEGGMGVVYKAWQRSADRIVALKVILPHRLAGLSPEQRRKTIERFVTEGQAAAQLEHDHIVTVYEVGETNGQPFYSMRYVEGASLQDLLQAGPLDGRRAAAYLEPVVRAVHHAHQHGILHRDLKPHNILVESASDRPLVADFGLAKLMQSGKDVTQTGEVMGTPPYMSPEQAQSSARVTVASDVYSLGATLYALVAGRPPFQADDPVATLRKVIEEEPVRPRLLNPQIDSDLETICLACLEKEPSRRYQSAAALAQDLEHWLKGEPITIRPAGRVERAWRWCRRKPVLAGMSAVIGTLALVILVGAPIAAFLLNEGRLRAVTAESDAKDQLNRALTAEADATEKLGQVQMDRYSLQIGFAQQLIDDGKILLGRKVLDQCPAELRDFEHHYLWTLCQRRMRSIAQDQWAFSVCFSPDGKCFATAMGKEELLVWDTITGKRLYALPHPRHVLSVKYSPDGKQLASYSKLRDLRDTQGEVRVWDSETRLLRHSFQTRVPTDEGAFMDFSPDARWLATGFSFDPRDNRNHGSIWDLTAGKEAFTLKDSLGPALFTPDGKHLVHGKKDGAVIILETKTFSMVRALKAKQPRLMMACAVSPDGKKLVCLAGDRDKKSNGALTIWDLTTGQESLSVNQTAFSAAFGPDGEAIALGQEDVVRVVDVRSGREKVSYKGDLGLVVSVAFSPDGKWLASASFTLHSIFGHKRGAKVILWQTAPQDQLFLDHKQVSGVAFSPDGKRVASASSGSIKVWDVKNGKLLLATTVSGSEQLHDVAFNSGGDRIVTASTRSSGKDKQDVLVVTEWDAGTGRNLLSRTWKAKKFNHLYLSRDGQRVLSGAQRNYQLQTIWSDPNPKNQPRLVFKDPLILRDTATGQILEEIEGREYTNLAFDPNGKRIALCQLGTTAVLGGQSPVDINLDPLCLIFNWDGTCLVGISHDGLVEMWDIRTGRSLQSFQSRWEVKEMALSPDGKRLALISRDGMLALWDVKTGEEVLKRKTTHTGTGLLGSCAIAFSPDGEHFAMAGGDTVEIWSAAPVTDDRDAVLRDNK